MKYKKRMNSMWQVQITGDPQDTAARRQQNLCRSNPSHQDPNARAIAQGFDDTQQQVYNFISGRVKETLFLCIRIHMIHFFALFTLYSVFSIVKRPGSYP